MQLGLQLGLSATFSPACQSEPKVNLNQTFRHGFSPAKKADHMEPLCDRADPFSTRTFFFSHV